MIKNLRWPIHLLFGLFVIMLTAYSAFAQNSPVKGQILNEADQPIAGINIKIKGAVLSTKSGEDGRFTINAAANDILVFSAVSFKTQEIPVTPGKEIRVVLLMDMKGLDEVVVIGYGTQRKSNLTSAVSSVSKRREIAAGCLKQPNKCLTRACRRLNSQQSGRKSGAGS
ncbi:carboxypeptidase-like regulatory domain-containing protein [Pedobacter sp. NJ-S-72]